MDNNLYEYTDLLGRGAFGVVLKVKDQFNR